MITPSLDLKYFGGQVILLAPRAAWSLLRSTSGSSFAGIGLSVGLLANAFVIVRVHWAICAAAVLAPYAAYISLEPALHVHPWQTALWQGASWRAAFRMAFYFPWALGICLINTGRPGTERAVS
jgi:hypothetical protein